MAIVLMVLERFQSHLNQHCYETVLQASKKLLPGSTSSYSFLLFIESTWGSLALQLISDGHCIAACLTCPVTLFFPFDDDGVG